MADTNDAKKKIEAERKKAKPESAESSILDFLDVWLEYQPEAATLLTASGKTPAGAYGFMRQKAAKNHQKCAADEEAMVWILEYYGAADPRGLIEGGLMYACIQAKAEKWRPYGANPQAPANLAEPKGPDDMKPKSQELSLDDLFM